MGEILLQNFTKIYTYMVFTKIFFGYDKAQIKREAKKNDSTDSNDKKQQQHSAEQQKPNPGEKLLLAGDLDHGEDGGNQSSIHLSDCFIVRIAGNEEDPVFQNLSDDVRIAYGNRFFPGGSNFSVYLPAEKRTPE